MDPKIKNFSDFWAFYLGEHRKPLTRALHVGGTTVALGTAFVAAVTRKPSLLLVALATGYIPAWIGHFFVEENKPASFRYPLWSFVADLKMCALTWAGVMDEELKRILGEENKPTNKAPEVTINQKTQSSLMN